MVVVETGYKPSFNLYPELWTRDHAYTVWHDVDRLPMATLNQFAAHRLLKRSTVANAGHANFIADRINANGVVTYKNAGSNYPYMDGIHFVVMILHSVFMKYGDRSVFLADKVAIDDCLAAIPRSGNHCVYSDPYSPSVDYGFTDSILKTGNVGYGTALQAWAYKMLAEINLEQGKGEYTLKFDETIAGLKTLRKSSGYYSGSSANNQNADDVWLTALVVAENLVLDQNARLVSAQRLATDYVKGLFNERGWIRHLPKGTYWVGATTGRETYQNGSFWLTPLWDMYRAINLVSSVIANQVKNNALREVYRQIQKESVYGPLSSPYEWANGQLYSDPKGYIASAAIVKRFS